MDLNLITVATQQLSTWMLDVEVYWLDLTDEQSEHICYGVSVTWHPNLHDFMWLLCAMCDAIDVSEKWWRFVLTYRLLAEHHVQLSSCRYPKPKIHAIQQHLSWQQWCSERWNYFFRSLWHLTKAFLESCHEGRIFNENPRVLSDSDVNDQQVSMFLTTCYNHECFIINEHGSGATHCYGDEDFMGQCKRLARKVHKNTLELRMIMRWLLRVRHPDLAAWGKRRLISLWIYPQDLIEISRILSDLNVLIFWGHWLL